MNKPKGMSDDCYNLIIETSSMGKEDKLFFIDIWDKMSVSQKEMLKRALEVEIESLRWIEIETKKREKEIEDKYKKIKASNYLI